MAEPKESQETRDAAIDKREAADGHPPAPSEPAAVGDAHFVSEEMMYAGMRESANPDHVPEGPDAPDPSDATSSGNHPDLPGADDAPPARDTTDTAEPEKPAADAEPKATEPGQAPSPTAWNKDRQRLDQDNANLRTQGERLGQQVQTLATRVEELAAGQTPPGGIGDKTDEELKDLVELDEYATEADRNAAVNELIRRDGIRRKRDDARDQASTETDQQTKNRKAYTELLAKAEAKYGKEHRNEAVKRIQQQWTDQGFSDDYFPDPASTGAAVMGIFAEVAAEAKAAPAKTRPRTSAPAHDPGAGGSQAPSSQDAGMESLDDVMDDMLAKGQLRQGV